VTVRNWRHFTGENIRQIFANSSSFGRAEARGAACNGSAKKNVAGILLR